MLELQKVSESVGTVFIGTVGKVSICPFVGTCYIPYLFQTKYRHKNSPQLLLYLDLLPGRLSCQINSELPVNLGVAFHIQNLC